MGRHALDGERPGNPHLALVLIRLVVEELVLRMAADRRIDLLSAHSLVDVWIVRNRLQRDVLDALVNETMSDVVRRLRGRQRRPGELALLLSALRRIRQ